MKHRSAALAAEPSESPQTTFVSGLLLRSVIIYRTDHSWRKKQWSFYCASCLFPPFFHWHSFYSDIEKDAHIFPEVQRVFFQAQCWIILWIFMPHTILVKHMH